MGTCNSTNMNIGFCILLLQLLQLSVSECTHMSGRIMEYNTFFYRKLPVTPSVRTTIEFSVSYQWNSMRYNYPSMDIYTEYPQVNIDKRCSYVNFGQLRNENLHPYLKLGRYRTTTCKLSGVDTMNCRGKVKIRDYTPSNF